MFSALVTVITIVICGLTGSTTAQTNVDVANGGGYTCNGGTLTQPLQLSNVVASFDITIRQCTMTNGAHITITNIGSTFTGTVTIEDNDFQGAGLRIMTGAGSAIGRNATFIIRRNTMTGLTGFYMKDLAFGASSQFTFRENTVNVSDDNRAVVPQSNPFQGYNQCQGSATKLLGCQFLDGAAVDFSYNRLNYTTERTGNRCRELSAIGLYNSKFFGEASFSSNVIGITDSSHSWLTLFRSSVFSGSASHAVFQNNSYYVVSSDTGNVRQSGPYLSYDWTVEDHATVEIIDHRDMYTNAAFELAMVRLGGANTKMHRQGRFLVKRNHVYYRHPHQATIAILWIDTITMTSGFILDFEDNEADFHGGQHRYSARVNSATISNGAQLLIRNNTARYVSNENVRILQIDRCTIDNALIRLDETTMPALDSGSRTHGFLTMATTTLKNSAMLVVDRIVYDVVCSTNNFVHGMRLHDVVMESSSTIVLSRLNFRAVMTTATFADIDNPRAPILLNVQSLKTTNSQIVVRDSTLTMEGNSNASAVYLRSWESTNSTILVSNSTALVQVNKEYPTGVLIDDLNGIGSGMNVVSFENSNITLNLEGTGNTGAASLVRIKNATSVNGSRVGFMWFNNTFTFKKNMGTCSGTCSNPGGSFEPAVIELADLDRPAFVFNNNTVSFNGSPNITAFLHLGTHDDALLNGSTFGFADNSIKCGEYEVVAHRADCASQVLVSVPTTTETGATVLLRCNTLNGASFDRIANSSHISVVSETCNTCSVPLDCNPFTALTVVKDSSGGCACTCAEGVDHSKDDSACLPALPDPDQVTIATMCTSYFNCSDRSTATAIGIDGQCTCECQTGFEGNCSTCNERYSGATCNLCNIGYLDYPSCVPCTIAANCSGQATSVTGNHTTGCKCDCKDGYGGVDCRTETQTLLPTGTASNSQSSSPTGTMTSTPSNSLSPSQGTQSLSPSKSFSYSQSHTGAASSSASRTGSHSQSASVTNSGTLTRSGTASPSRTSSRAGSVSISGSPSPSVSLKATATPADASVTSSISGTRSPSHSDTSSISIPFSELGTVNVSSVQIASLFQQWGDGAKMPVRVLTVAIVGDAFDPLSANRSCAVFLPVGENSTSVEELVDYLRVNVTLDIIGRNMAAVTFHHPGGPTDFLDISGRISVVPDPICFDRRTSFRAFNISLVAVPVVEEKETVLLPKEVVRDSKAVAATGTALTAMTTPVTATMLARSTMLLGINTCEPSPEPLDNMVSPTGVEIGSRFIAQYLGGAVVNPLVAAGLALIHFIACKAYAAKSGISYKEAATALRFPALQSFPVMLLMQPTVMCAFVCALRGGSLERGIGITVLVLISAIPVATLAAIRRNFHSVYYPDWDAELRTRGEEAGVADEVEEAMFRHRLRRRLEVFLNGKGMWTDEGTGAHPGFTDRNDMWFVDYRHQYRWFLAAEMAMSIACGIVEGMKLGAGRCNGVLAVFIAVFALFLIATIKLHPHSSEYLFFFCVLLTCLNLLGAVCMAAHMYGGATNGQVWAEWCTMASLYLIAIKTFIDFGPKIWLWISTVRATVSSGLSKAKSDLDLLGGRLTKKFAGPKTADDASSSEENLKAPLLTEEERLDYDEADAVDVPPAVEHLALEEDGEEMAVLPSGAAVELDSVIGPEEDEAEQPLLPEEEGEAKPEFNTNEFEGLFDDDDDDASSVESLLELNDDDLTRQRRFLPGAEATKDVSLMAEATADTAAIATETEGLLAELERIEAADGDGAAEDNSDILMVLDAMDDRAIVNIILASLQDKRLRYRNGVSRASDETIASLVSFVAKTGAELHPTEEAQLAADRELISILGAVRGLEATALQRRLMASVDHRAATVAEQTKMKPNGNNGGGKKVDKRLRDILSGLDSGTFDPTEEDDVHDVLGGTGLLQGRREHLFDPLEDDPLDDPVLQDKPSAAAAVRDTLSASPDPRISLDVPLSAGSEFDITEPSLHHDESISGPSMTAPSRSVPLDVDEGITLQADELLPDEYHYVGDNEEDDYLWEGDEHDAVLDVDEELIAHDSTDYDVYPSNEPIDTDAL